MPIRINKHSAFKTQCFVIKALLRREVVTRFGKYKLGVLWMLVDPLISVIILGVVLGPLLGRTSGEIPYAFFLLCGFMMLSALTGTINASLGAIGANQGLLVFRQVQPIDPFLARFIFELLSIIIAFFVFCFIGAWLGIVLSTDRLFSLLYCIIITWLTGCGIGLFLGVKSIQIKELEKIQQYLQRPLIFVSGILYPTIIIPPDYCKILLMNPLVHTVEYSRKCLFPEYLIPEGINLYYPSLWALGALTFGMMTYRNNRHLLTEK